MAKSAKSKSKNSSDISGIAFAGCMMIGLGIGSLVHQTGAGVLIGMGVGFGVMAWVRAKA